MPESATVIQAGFYVLRHTEHPALSPQYSVKLRTFTVGKSPWEWDVVRDATTNPRISEGFQFVELTATGSTTPLPYDACWGDMLALTIEYETGTIGPTNFIEIVSLAGGFEDEFGYAFPTLWVKDFIEPGWDRIREGIPVVALRSSTNTYGFTAHNADIIGEQNSGDRAGMRFKLPSGFGSNFRLAGIRSRANLIPQLGSVDPIEMNLWESNPNSSPLQSAVFDKGILNPVNDVEPYRELFFADQPMNPLDYGTEYFVAFRSGAVPIQLGVRLGAILVADEDLMSALPGGKEVYGAWFDNSENLWVHEKKLRPQIDLILAPYETT